MQAYSPERSSSRLMLVDEAKRRQMRRSQKVARMSPMRTSILSESLPSVQGNFAMRTDKSKCFQPAQPMGVKRLGIRGNGMDCNCASCKRRGGAMQARWQGLA